MAFPRFVIAGAVNTGMTYVIYLILLLFMPYVWAYSFTYIVGIFLGYALNSRWVFKKPPSLHSATVYPLTYGFNYLLGVGLLWILVEKMKTPEQLAPLVVVAISVPVMYWITKAIFERKLNEKIID